MKEPTEEQIKRFWEWCGIKPTKHYEQTHFQQGAFYWEYPPIDLNNLFKYGSSLFVSMACGSINEENWKGAWAKAITHDRQKIGEIGEVGLTPALALFWAIYKVLKKE